MGSRLPNCLKTVNQIVEFGLSLIVFQLSIVVSAHYCFLSNCVTSNGRSDTQPLVYRLDKAVLQCICCQWLLVLLILTDSILPGEPKRLMAMWLLECH